MPIYLDETDLPVAASTTLAQNLRVEVKLTLDDFDILAADGDALSQASTTVFFTTASPMYTTVDYVLLSCGELAEALPDVAVWLMIYSASTWIDDILLFDPDVKFPDQSDSNQNWQFFQRARMELAKCKACRDIMRSALANRGLSAGRRTLADFTIDLSGQANLISQARSFANEMSSQCQYWLDALYSGGAADFQNLSPQSGVKSGKNTSEPGGIGRGWIVGGPTMNRREKSTISNGSKTRPRRGYGRGGF
jgi:hypothetical protein